MKPKDMHRSTGAAFDEAAVRYEAELVADIEFLRGGGQNFCPPELPYLAELGRWCRRAIHLQCAGGRDTLSLWNRGAHEVVGVDISQRMIRCAEQKAAALAAPSQWFCCDVLDTPAELDGSADLVYTGRGALCWMQDLPGWARVVARLLKPGGRVFIFEGHPIAELWDRNADHLRLDDEWGGYFRGAAIADRGWHPSYIGQIDVPVEQQSLKYERLWNLGQIVTAVNDAGLRLLRLEEHPDEFWEGLPNLPKTTVRRLPNTFSLLAVRPAEPPS